MAVTHFEIVKLPNKKYISSFIGADALVTGQLYPISRQSEIYFERIPFLNGLHAEGRFTYKAYDQDNDMYSNEAISSVEWKSPLDPSSQDVIIPWADAQMQLLLQIIPINAGVEFIEVHNNFGAHFENGSKGKIEIGGRLITGELFDTKIVADLTNGDNVTVQYKLGKNGQVTSTVYSLTIDMSQAL